MKATSEGLDGEFQTIRARRQAYPREHTVDTVPDNFQIPGAVFHASPSVRQYARDPGIDLGSVSGTAPKGRISKEDLKSFIRNGLRGVGSIFHM